MRRVDADGQRRGPHVALVPLVRLQQHGRLKVLGLPRKHWCTGLELQDVQHRRPCRHHESGRIPSTPRDLFLARQRVVRSDPRQRLWTDRRSEHAHVPDWPRANAGVRERQRQAEHHLSLVHRELVSRCLVDVQMSTPLRVPPERRTGYQHRHSGKHDRDHACTPRTCGDATSLSRPGRGCRFTSTGRLSPSTCGGRPDRASQGTLRIVIGSPAPVDRDDASHVDDDAASGNDGIVPAPRVTERQNRGGWRRRSRRRRPTGGVRVTRA